jgi:hypothetical protein
MAVLANTSQEEFDAAQSLDFFFVFLAFGH